LGVGGSTLFLGSAHNIKLKGMDTAIRAVRRLAAQGADVVLAIAGGEPDAKWRAMTACLGKRVRFLGLVDDMTPLFAAADALVHPTRWDACSLSTIEAGAAGLSVITTARNGAAELIREGETGFVLPDPEDVAALADRIGRLLDPALRARMGAAAREASLGHDLRANYEAVERVMLANTRAGNARAAGS
jgi:UDP-glucose:(heptosyl)LPS alpha-1,3-glucosyltransferase